MPVRSKKIFNTEDVRGPRRATEIRFLARMRLVRQNSVATPWPSHVLRVKSLLSTPAGTPASKVTCSDANAVYPERTAATHSSGTYGPSARACNANTVSHVVDRAPAYRRPCAIVVPAPCLQSGDARLDFGGIRIMCPERQRVQDAVHRRQGLEIGSTLLRANAPQAAIERPTAQCRSTGQAPPDRAKRRHHVVGQTQRPPRRHIQIGGRNAMTRQQPGPGEVGKLAPQRRTDFASVSPQTNARQISHAQVDIAGMAIQPVSGERRPGGHQEQLRWTHRHPVAVVQAKQRQPEPAPGGQRAEPLPMTRQPSRWFAQQRRVRRLAQQARRDIYKRSNEQIRLRFRV